MSTAKSVSVSAADEIVDLKRRLDWIETVQQSTSTSSMSPTLSPGSPSSSAQSDELRILRDVRILRADADRNNFILGEKIDRCRADAIAYSMDSAVRLGKRITVVDLTLQNNVSVIGMLKIEQGKTKDAISELAKGVRGLNSNIDANRAEAVNLSSTVDQGFVGVERALRSNGSAIRGVGVKVDALDAKVNSLDVKVNSLEKGQQMMMKQMERSEKGQQMMMKQMTMMMKQMNSQ